MSPADLAANGDALKGAAFLGSAEQRRFFVPARLRTAPRAASVKDGRRPPKARSVLDGSEHGAMLGGPEGVGVRQSARQGGSGLAGRPAFRGQAGRLEIVRRPLPRRVVATLARRIGGLLRPHVRQSLGQPLVLDDRAGLHRADLVEHPKRQGNAVVPHGEPAVR